MIDDVLRVQTIDRSLFAIMDHISKIMREDSKPPPASPGTGVSQSKFISPCRSVGLRRIPPNKFVVKFKEIVNCDKNNEISNPVEGGKPSNVLSIAKKRESSGGAQEKIELMKDGVSKETDSENTNTNKSICDQHYGKKTKSNTAELKNIVSNDKFSDKTCNLVEEVTQKCLENKAIRMDHFTMNESPSENESISSINARKCPSPNLMQMKSSRSDENYENSSNGNVSNFHKEHENLSVNYIDDFSRSEEHANSTSCTDNSHELETSSKDILDKTSNTTSNENSANLSCPKLSESNSSLCDNLSKSNLLSIEEITECSVAENSQRNSIPKTRNVKRFKTPMKEGFVAKRIKLEPIDGLSDVEKKIAEKEKKITEMKAIIANSLKVRTIKKKEEKCIFFFFECDD